jgi:3-oxoacyl-[acyl-carrier-protein] synthase II
MRRVVITGLGAVSPLGCDLETIWSRLTGGFSGVGKVTKFDASNHSSQVAAELRDYDVNEFLDAKSQRRMDAFSHYAIAASSLAVKDSGIDWDKTDPDYNGCIVSSGVGGIGTTEAEVLKMAERGPGRVSPFCIPQIISNIASGMVAIEHNLKGPNYAVVSACASGLHSIGDALRLIQRGDANIMLAGGCEASITPISMAGFSAMRALSTRNDSPETASRPFDRDRDGFVMGEGAAVLVMEEYEQAKARGARIYAEVAGFGMTCDAFHMTAPASDGRGGARSMMLAMKDAGLNAADVDYINAHGTSTPLNDKIETGAIKQALGEEDARRIMVSSSKSMTGHLLGAAGALESLVCALIISRGVVTPTINYTTPDPECDLDYVPNTAREAKVTACLNNSLGFGGHNACIAFRAI